MDLSFSGAVKVKLVATVETGATCHYETKGLAGTQLFGVEISGTALTGTAKLQKNPKSPPTCAKTVAVEALLEAAPPAGEAFTPRLV